MKQFFGAFFGSLIGLLAATLLAVILIVAAIKSSIGGAMRDEREEYAVKDNSVLHLKLNGALVDREIDSPLKELENLGITDNRGSGLNAIIKKIKQAKSDGKIKGIYLEIKDIDGSFANISELRDALTDFRASGKFICAYAEYYGQKEYYLASAASSVALNPQGIVEFKGLSMSLMFYKNTFEKLGVEIQTFRHGKFKSAIEPFILDKMSQANRLQSEAFLNSIWNNLLGDISRDRKLEITELQKIANELLIRTPDDAKKSGLVDMIAYEDEVYALLRKKLGQEEKEKPNLVNLRKYRIKAPSEIAKDRIAVVYANGAIKSGEGTDDEIGSDRIARAIREARLDKRVKAIVLRVNSPGGSALASDVIWREVNLAKAVKPTIVSMGNFAASGGYYISCAAHRIFAQPNTITGSIGVFGLLPNVQKALQDKLGITVDTVNTNVYSSMGNAVMPVREKEREYIQGSVEKVYDTFITKVAEGRGLDKAMVDSIGQGRVWSGADAAKIGLVDELGGLSAAVAYAAKQAKVSEYRLLELPKPKNPFDMLLGKSEEEAEARIMKKNLGFTYTYLKQMQNLISSSGIQARLPFEVIIK